MLRLGVICCLLAAAAAQTRYYCDPGSTVTGVSDFYLTTRPQSAIGYPPGLTCQLSARSPTSAFFVEVLNFQLGSAVLTIKSGGRVLFRGSRLSKFQASITTTSDSLEITFDATGDYSRSSGAELHVRSLDANECPPGWDYQYGRCFGTGDFSGQLNFVDAQKACNNMRANLLHIPAGYGGSMGGFFRGLPNKLRSGYTWAGLTDRTSYGQYRPYWLNGDRQYFTSEISCVSAGSYSTCYSRERCGALNTRTSLYALYMADCQTAYNYACSMPPRGTDTFYTVPNYEGIISNFTFNTYWIYGIVAASMFVIGLVVVGIYTGVRASNRRVAGPTPGVGVPFGQAPPTGAYPVQPFSVQLGFSQQYPGGPPPYAAASAGGLGNAGYVK